MSDSLRLHGLHSPWNSPDQNTRVSSLFLLWRIFPTQEPNPGLLHCRQILYQLSYKRNPRILEWVAYPFCSRSSQLRNQIGVSCIAGGFFTNWAIRKCLLLMFFLSEVSHARITSLTSLTMSIPLFIDPPSISFPSEHLLCCSFNNAM